MGHWVSMERMNAYHGTEISRRRSCMYVCITSLISSLNAKINDSNHPSPDFQHK